MSNIQKKMVLYNKIVLFTGFKMNLKNDNLFKKVTLVEQSSLIN